MIAMTRRRILQATRDYEATGTLPPTADAPEICLGARGGSFVAPDSRRLARRLRAELARTDGADADPSGSGVSGRQGGRPPCQTSRSSPMITALDHIVLIVRDLAASIRAYETLLGVSVAWRAKADGAETAMFTLANMSLELMAPANDVDGAAGERLRTALDQQGEGLASLCFRSNDLAALHRRLTRLDLAPEPIADAESVNLLDGERLAWRRTRAATEKTHGVRVFFLERQAERPRSAPVSAAPMVGLDHVVVGTRHPERAAALYGARLKLDMALDRTNPAWGSRLMFFRCGDLIVEIAHRLNETGDAPDSMFGLSWRADDIDGARARLAATGLDVSEVRDGRKPGTRVFTVRDGHCGVPTLVLKPTPPRNAGAMAARG